jgi:S1-C subfamily serine protease
MKKLLTVLLTIVAGSVLAGKPAQPADAWDPSRLPPIVYPWETLTTPPIVYPSVGDMMRQSQEAIANMHRNQRAIANEFTPVELYRLESPIVVTVACDLGDKQYMQGTGVIIDEHTIITNWHVVRGAKTIVAWDYNGTKYENGRLGNFNMSVDVACITFVTMHSTKSALFVTDSNGELPGEAVYAIGTPEGMAQTFTSGMFSGWLTNGATFRFTAPTGHGGSGGPIFNAYGQVIGIVRGGFGEGGGLNFGISTNAIFEALHLTSQNHPKGFVTGVTNGVELRSEQEIAKDNDMAVPPDHIDFKPLKGSYIPNTSPNEGRNADQHLPKGGIAGGIQWDDLSSLIAH